MQTESIHHDLLIYDSDEQYVEQVVPFFEAGLDEGDALIAVPARARDRLLRDALGPAAEHVTFHICEDWYTRPESVVAEYDAAVRFFLREGRPGVRLVAELPVCSSAAEWDEWVRYEAVINMVFADRPVSIICTCDTRALPGYVIDAMRRTHPHVVADGRHENPHFHHPAEVLRTHTLAPEPLPDLHDVPFDGDAQSFRDALARELDAAGVPSEDAQAMILAAGEVFANADRHGNGVQTVRVGGDAASFVCEVSDAGRGLDDPLAGYVPPGAPAASGGGLWVARQLTRRLELTPSPRGGLTVRLWA
jgi:anti-sigma regulatory factor (Ser/Thr protein kinase)